MADEHLAKGLSKTVAASRYLQQLCKHWSHKATAEFNESHGVIAFENGNRVEMSATEDALEIVVTAPSFADLDQWMDVVEKHLVRFAFREDFTIEWAN